MLSPLLRLKKRASIIVLFCFVFQRGQLKDPTLQPRLEKTRRSAKFRRQVVTNLQNDQLLSTVLCSLGEVSWLV